LVPKLIIIITNYFLSLKLINIQRFSYNLLRFYKLNILLINIDKVYQIMKHIYMSNTYIDNPISAS